MLISYAGIVIGYVNKGLLFLLILSTEQIGLVNLLLSIGLLFAQFANLGNTYSTWKFLPFFKNEKNKHHGFLPLILLTVLAGVTLFTVLFVLFRPLIESQYIAKSAEFVDYYYWVLPIGIGYVLFMSLEAYLRGFYKNIISVVANELILRISNTILLIFLWLGWINFSQFVVLYSVFYLIPSLILLIYLYRTNELNLSLSSIKISKRFRKILLDYSAFNYVNTLGVVLVASLDVIMIAQIIGLEATGVYATVVFLTSAIQVPYRSVLRISSPLVAEYWKSREINKIQELYTKVSSTGLVIGLSAFCILWMNIDFLFSFLKPEFQPGIWVFFFLMMGRLLDMFFGINGAIFSTSKKYKYDLIFTTVLIGLVYSLNLIFIPKWGMIGAAISTALALIVYNIGRIIFVWKIFKIHPFTLNQFKIIGLGVLSIFAGEFMKEFIENQWLELVAMCSLFLFFFIIPIYIFNLEPDIKNFLHKGLGMISKKNRTD